MTPDDLGIPEGAPVHSGSAQLPEGWTMEWVGIRVQNPPEWPPPWPYRLLTTDRLSLLIQVWIRSLHRPGFTYEVRWHPQYGRTYTANGDDPGALAQLVKEAQRVIRRETRGRRRRRPTPQQYVLDFDRIARAIGRRPSRARMADEYGVRRDTIRSWLQRPEWRESVPDKYRAE